MADNKASHRALAALFALLSVPFTSVLYGFVLSRLWDWFVVVAFSAPHLGKAHAIGLATVVKLITYQSTADKEPDNTVEGILECVLKAVLIPAFALSSGWIVKQFM